MKRFLLSVFTGMLLWAKVCPVRLTPPMGTLFLYSIWRNLELYCALDLHRDTTRSSRLRLGCTDLELHNPSQYTPQLRTAGWVVARSSNSSFHLSKEDSR
jgi:hypothetical protein